MTSRIEFEIDRLNMTTSYSQGQCLLCAGDIKTADCLIISWNSRHKDESALCAMCVKRIKFASEEGERH